MRLLLDGEPSGTQRLRMLVEKRSAALDVIHFKERQLLRLNTCAMRFEKHREEEEVP